MIPSESGQTLNDMEFEFNNFGKAGSGTICINDLTVICGSNNTGKTYINYAVYSILKNLKSVFPFKFDDGITSSQIESLKDNGSVRIQLSGPLKELISCKSNPIEIMGSEINRYFQVPNENFKDTKILIKLENLDVSSPIFYISNNFHALDAAYQFENSNGYLDLTINKEKYDLDSIEYFFNDYPGTVNYLESKISELLYNAHLKNCIPEPFSITSERTGISLFYKAYDAKNESIVRFLNELGNGVEIDSSFVSEMLAEMYSNHALPIKDNIALFRNIESKSKNISFIYENLDQHKSIVESLNRLLDYGLFEYNNGLIYFSPDEKHSKNEPISPLHAASSSIKSLFLFDVFIRYIAQENSLLIIDEPELNLFIDKQVEMAHLVARLVKAGVKVLVTTHSDYFIREINNFITLNNGHNNCKLMEELKIADDDLLEMTQVNAYRTDFDGKIHKIDMYKTGIDPESWNKQIVNENIKSDKIYRHSLSNGD